MRHFLFVVLLAAIGMQCDAAHARKLRVVVNADAGDDYVNRALPDNGTVWHCWYDGGTAIRCRLGESFKAAIETVGRAASAIDHRLPQIVKDIWRKPEAMSGKQVSIPLHTVPYDMALTGQLADAVMCGGANGPCGIIFARNPGLLVELVMDRARQLAARSLATVAMGD